MLLGKKNKTTFKTILETYNVYYSLYSTRPSKIKLPLNILLDQNVF